MTNRKESNEAAKDLKGLENCSFLPENALAERSLREKAGIDPAAHR